MNSIDPKAFTALSLADFEKIAAYCYERAELLLQHAGEVAPVILAGTIRDGSVNIKFTRKADVSKERDKDRLADFIIRLVERPMFDFVVHITEVWFSSSPCVDKPSNDPRRKEAVVFNICSKDSQIVVMNELRRDPLRLERGEVGGFTKMLGRFVRHQPPRH